MIKSTSDVVYLHHGRFELHCPDAASFDKKRALIERIHLVTGKLNNEIYIVNFLMHQHYSGSGNYEFTFATVIGKV